MLSGIRDQAAAVNLTTPTAAGIRAPLGNYAATPLTSRRAGAP